MINYVHFIELEEEFWLCWVGNKVARGKKQKQEIIES